MAWGLEGRQFDRKTALAQCYARGFTGAQRVITAACVMSAESLRYEKAWHENVNEETGEVLSCDRGLFQINDKAHPGLDPEEMFDARTNLDAAFAIYKGRGNQFTAWMAYNSGAYLRFWPEFAAVWALQTWRRRIPRWQADLSPPS
jgi:hypothetical protein